MLATTHDLDEWIKNSPVREEDHDTAPSITVTAEAGVIRANIAEMHRLRVQMSVLRNELHESLRRLQYRIDELGDTAPREEPASEHLVLALLEGPPPQTYQMLKVAHWRKAS